MVHQEIAEESEEIKTSRLKNWKTRKVIDEGLKVEALEEAVVVNKELDNKEN